MKQLSRFALNVSLATLLASALPAQIVTITASGPITGASAGNTFAYTNGDQVSLTVTYDLDAPLISSGNNVFRYGANANFVFGDSTFSGDAVIWIDINNANNREGFLVLPEFDTSGGSSSYRPLSTDVSYTGPVDLTGYGFSTGGFSWLDGHLPAGTFVSGSLAAFDPVDYAYNSQNGGYRIDFSDSATGNSISYNYSTMSVSVSAVPEPGTYALLLGGVLGLGGMLHRVRRMRAVSTPLAS